MRLSPPVKLILMLITFYLIIISESFLDYFMIFITLSIISKWYHVSSKDLLRALKFESWIIILLVIINLFLGKGLTSTFYFSIGIALHIFLMLLLALVYKKTSSLREIAYGISYNLQILRPFGYNPHYTYTLLLVVLSQVYNLRIRLIKIMKVEKMKNSNAKTFKIIKNLTIPFIYQTLDQDQSLAASLVNKGYSHQQKKLNNCLMPTTNYLFLGLNISLIVIGYLMIGVL